MMKPAKRPELERDEKGVPLMTLKYLIAQCEFNGGYMTPHLNETLYLTQKGFKKCENLEEYYNVKTLYLDGNGMSDIQGLSSMIELRQLFLADNLIRDMSALSNLINLDSINLSKNCLIHVSGLENLKLLTKLDLSGNKLDTAESIANLQHNSGLKIIFLQENPLDYESNKDSIIPLLKSLPKLKVINLNETPYKRMLKDYRKLLIVELQNLTYLDSRTVTDDERRRATAFLSGGKQAETEVIDEIKEEKNQLYRDYINQERIQRGQLTTTSNEEQEATDDPQKILPYNRQIARWNMEQIIANKRKLEDLEEKRAEKQKQVQELIGEVEAEKRRDLELKQEQERINRLKQKIEQEQLVKDQEEEKLKESLQNRTSRLVITEVTQSTDPSLIQKIKKRNQESRAEYLQEVDKRLGLEPETRLESMQFDVEIAESELESLDKQIRARREQAEIIQKNYELAKEGKYTIQGTYYIKEDAAGKVSVFNCPQEKEQEIIDEYMAQKQFLKEYEESKHKFEVKPQSKKSQPQFKSDLDFKDGMMTEDSSMSNIRTQDFSQTQSQISLEDTYKSLWTPELENIFEEIIEAEMFDFPQVSIKMNNILSKRSREKGLIHQLLTSEDLRQKWKEIELRKYRNQNPGFMATNTNEVDQLKNLKDESMSQSEDLGSGFELPQEFAGIKYDNVLCDLDQVQEQKIKLLHLFLKLYTRNFGEKVQKKEWKIIWTWKMRNSTSSRIQL